MNITESIQNVFQKEVIDLVPLSGGSISSAYKAVLSDSVNIFVKVDPQYPDMFIQEANGLRELAAAQSLRVPEVLFSDESLLLLEFFPVSPLKNRKKFFEDFGRSFAVLHHHTAEQFGFHQDNYIGSTPQKNVPRSHSWRDFYWEHRLLFQFQLAEQNGHSHEELRTLFSLLEEKLEEIIPDDGEPPALLHGDLWSGNYLCLEYDIPAIIDPAAYYGHREADLGMTLLFGGFGDTFYSAYNEEYPLQEGWKFRMEIYKLYHLLNHLNLFGDGYYGQVIQTMNRLIGH